MTDYQKDRLIFITGLLCIFINALLAFLCTSINFWSYAGILMPLVIITLYIMLNNLRPIGFLVPVILIILTTVVVVILYLH